MIRFTTGNLLDQNAEALVNTVNTVGVMGKGIALMFKEAFPQNFKAYAEACKNGEVVTGKMFVVEGPRIAGGPDWIVNFPTKQHWRSRTKIEWVIEGLDDLVRWIQELGVKSIAIPPLGCGNGGLEWSAVKPVMEDKLEVLSGVDIVIFEPTDVYQNVAKREGIEALTPARALIAELVRRYSVIGIQCSLLEVQKLAWFLERSIEHSELELDLSLKFEANRYGPYAEPLRHLLNNLDGSYLESKVRIPDAKPTDVVAFNSNRKEFVKAYLDSEAKEYLPILDHVARVIDGFESPLGLELLATIDWLVSRERVPPKLEAVMEALREWNGGGKSANRKVNLFSDRLILLALDRLDNAVYA